MFSTVNSNKQQKDVKTDAMTTGPAFYLPVRFNEKTTKSTQVDEDIYNKYKDSAIRDCGGYAKIGTKTLHQLILGKIPKHVIDHIDSNPFNNTRANLRHVTTAQNNQNAQRDRTTMKSPYIGVTHDKTRDKWQARLAGKHIGRFSTMECAAYAYDVWVQRHPSFSTSSATGETIEHKPLINGIAKPADWDNNFKFPDEKPQTNRDLPKGVYLDRGKYHAMYSKNGKMNRVGIFDNIADAERAIRAAERDNKDAKLKQLLSTPINRNSNGIATISVVKDGKQYDILVDDDKYYDLMKTSWYINAYGYAVSSRNGVKIPMHRYLMGIVDSTHTETIVDHVNHNRIDNRLENLRLTTHAGNAHNRLLDKTTTTSKFIGVTKTKAGTWTSSVSKDNVTHSLGTFKTEEGAAAAYNQKAAELYTEQANVNKDIPTTVVPDKVPQKKEGCASKYIGVRLSYGKWTAAIKHNNVKHNLGVYESEVDAAIAYNKKAIELKGSDYSKINPGLPDKPVVRSDRPTKAKSGHKYITLTSGGKWQVTISANKKKQYVGTFATVEEAIRQRDEKIISLKN